MTRHRRRREDSVDTPPADSERSMPQRIAPRPTPGPARPARDTYPAPAQPPAGRAAPPRRRPEPPATTGGRPQYSRPAHTGIPTGAGGPVPGPHVGPGPNVQDGGERGAPLTGRPHAGTGQAGTGLIDATGADAGHSDSGHPDFGHTGTARSASAAGSDAGTDTRTRSDRREGRRRGGTDGGAADKARRRTRTRMVLAFVLVFLLAMVGGLGYVALRTLGVIGAADYSDATGAADVIVEIPANSTLSDFGDILADRDVVKSSRAFVNAADGRTMEGGFYKLRTQIPAATAVEMMTDTSKVHRVGLMNVPEGLQLESKKGIDGKTTPGIFQMIADATEVDVNGAHRGVTVEELEKVAATADPAALGVPEWAHKWVTATAVKGDFRRLEGLIAPGTWDYINPEHSADAILTQLVSQSVSRFENWGLLNDNGSGLTPYETLITASIVEREAKNADDFPKVARVILNRLAKDQRLEMDSTSNYRAEVTNIDVHGDAYSDANPWNTYQISGLPPTPIGAVGERALEATEHPATGQWLYFVSIDKDGNTLFADDYEEHKRNRQKACDTGLLSTGC
ncbi:endolytic transglycosylase MltG [Gordonia pseudamarae]|uniref:Endolytic murein transglycosylase n=2 Tax=Gordoniaceae TaxID=85026 RepID=A0ABX6INJ8_9ACTN|nr:endolytic transglycosylase MltG [Gordonia sp. (in: high G+C Gram-positive bacteria)]QHN28645.1 endolytic transglycosylase MltG [Gordonia pseudamarae]QHN37518.1 endolytic transglycosylase MltG [Gordonia pseudamarae]